MEPTTPTLEEFLTSNGFDFTPEFNTGWRPIDKYRTYIADERPLVSGKVLKVVTIRDWRSMESLVWKNALELSDDERSSLEEVTGKLKEEREAAKQAQNLQAAKEASEFWETTVPVNGHLPRYLEVKGLSGSYGGRTDRECTDTFVVPMRDVEGKLWGLQKIFASGEKLFIRGQRGRELFHVIGPDGSLDSAKTVYLCEGFATGASVYEATGMPVVVCFMANNLPAVAGVLSAKYPNHTFIVACDNDKHGKSNTGILMGKEAASVFFGRGSGETGFTFPQFKNWKGKETSDWNDLAREEGLEEVRRQVTAFTKWGTLSSGTIGVSTRGVDSTTGDVRPLELYKKDKTGAMVRRPPTQQELVDALLVAYGDKIIKQDRDLFLYGGTHWQEIGTSGRHRIMTQLQVLSGGSSTFNHLKGAYELFVCNVPSVPRGTNLFDPHPYCINLKNGTLHLIRTPGVTLPPGVSRYRVELRPHRKEDYLINLLPFDYEPDFASRNAPFEDMMARLFEGDPDGPEKRAALQQMFGACLISAWPHLFFLVGKPGTGKSTVIMLASKLVSKENWCSVEPHDFQGFNMESMAGKLLNFETDVSLDKPISDSSLKKVLDGRPICIRRKNRTDIFARLPAVHIFGGNDIPPTLEGSYKAHDRRWTFVEFNNIQTRGSYDKEFHEKVWEAGPQGVFNWAMRGFETLMAREGHYLNPASGVERMKEWQEGSDPVGQFLDFLGSKEAELEGKVFAKKEGVVKTSEMWGAFKFWFEDFYPGRKSSTPTRHFFHKTMRLKGCVKITRVGIEHYRGFESREQAEGSGKDILSEPAARRVSPLEGEY